ncbi:hypothetical protein HH308_22755 [Gordonia sp. TBRC 11910]|uniref:Uncharacterized protein n=1 Tax=Gordonia asplenii TaxID=2725283 RepID=A0A848L034_9ACTN|nr:hypothetical protein [Gordonia asplenii]NMO04039.1 hypothetical protein [Gordonia asplenii]
MTTFISFRARRVFFGAFDGASVVIFAYVGEPVFSRKDREPGHMSGLATALRLTI